jgi:hypothetical protein
LFVLRAPTRLESAWGYEGQSPGPVGPSPHTSASAVKKFMEASEGNDPERIKQAAKEEGTREDGDLSVASAEHRDPAARLIGRNEDRQHSNDCEHELAPTDRNSESQRVR